MPPLGGEIFSRSQRGLVAQPHLPRSHVVQVLVKSGVVVESHPLVHADLEFDEVLVLAQVDVLVLQAAPEALDEDVVDPAAIFPSMLILMPASLSALVHA